MSQTIANKTKTTRAVKQGFQRPWYVVDASKDSMGRVATIASQLLMGKNRADFQPDVDMGAMVVVINSGQTQTTGVKADKKLYFRHSGYPGGLKYRTFNEQMAKDSSRPLYHAIKGMLPKNRHQDLRMNNRLFIFDGAEHDIPNPLTPAN